VIECYPGDPPALPAPEPVEQPGPEPVIIRGTKFKPYRDDGPQKARKLVDDGMKKFADKNGPKAKGSFS